MRLSYVGATAFTTFGAAWALAGGTPLTTVRVASGLSNPLFVTAPPGDTTRAFIVEQRSGSVGRIRVLNLPGNTLEATPYLSISPVATGSEQGLLGLAFHPDYMTNGYFWVNFTEAGGTTRIVRYRANPPASNTADAGSATNLLSINQPFSNHNGGWMAFGPDGYLYISTGDGGSGNDPGNRAQNVNILLGKMLRIDVDGADDIPGNDDDDGQIGVTAPPYTIPPTNPFAGGGGAGEIWAYGLRNPWRPSFDRDTGDLFIADVGQNVWEEINFQEAGAAGGRNYGWRCMEGLNCTGLTGCTCNGPTLTLPFYTYNHSTDGGSCSITGGYVYRGCQIPDLQGTYFFADYCSSRIKSFRYDPVGGMTEFENRTAELDPPGAQAISSITSFGEDADGELYICDQGGEVFKIIPVTPGTDCDSNGVPDSCEADSDADGLPDNCDNCPNAANPGQEDCDGDGLGDACDASPCGCVGDLDGDDDIDLTDLSIQLGHFGGPGGPEDGDLDGDGDVDLTDLSLLLAGYGTSCG